jgi:hypothetical protein
MNLRKIVFGFVDIADGNSQLALGQRAALNFVLNSQIWAPPSNQQKQ